MKKLLQIFLAVLPAAIIFSSAFGGNSTCWIETIDLQDTSVFIGDTLSLQIMIDTNQEQITGFEFFLTIDPKILKPIFKKNKPFRDGNFIREKPFKNDTHNDVWGQPDTLNGIPGFQLDYVQLTPPAVGGVRTSVSGMSPVTSFDLEIVGVPQNPDELVLISFDRQNRVLRNTGYFLLEAPGTNQTFRSLRGFSLKLQGFIISPAIPDTFIVPGKTLEIDLNTHILGNVTPALLTWQYETLQALPNGIQIQINAENKLTVTTGESTNGLIEMKLTARDEALDCRDWQVMKIVVDHVPRFVNRPAGIVFNEDEKFKILKSELCTDQDDPAASLNIWFEGNFVHLLDSGGDSLTFTANPNWYGVETGKIFVQDPLMKSANITIDSLWLITVNSVNDPPIFDFQGISDSVVINPRNPKSLNLDEFVTDIDDQLFTYSVINPAESDLAAQVNGSMLNLSVRNPEFMGVIPLFVTAADDENGTDSDSLFVVIQSVPPKIGALPALILIHDSTIVLNLNDFVSDADTPLELLQWQFSAKDVITQQPDNKVVFNYSHERQEVEISSRHQQRAYDILVATVYDNTGNSDTRSTPLTILSVPRPVISPLPNVVIVTDTVIEAVDLDTLVNDPQDSVANLQWQVSGVKSLKAVNISPATHILTIESNASFIGSDTLTFIVTNSLMLSDTAQMAIRCVPRSPKPLILSLPDATFYWKQPAPLTYVHLEQYVWDFVTPPDSINWRLNYDTDFMNITLTDNNVVKVITGNRTGKKSVIFTATDGDGYSASDTAIFNIIEDAAPVWAPLEDVNIVKHQILPLFVLSEKCVDDATPATELVFSFETESPQRLNIELTPVVLISLADTTFAGTTWLRFSATDAHGHTTWSNTIKVTIGRSKPPVWRQIPTIEFDNGKPFSNLYLKDYCRDPENRKLKFSSLNTNPGLDIHIVDTTSQAILTCLSGFYGELDVVFQAADSDSNISSTVAKIVITDSVPPYNHISYYYNPVTPRRINFIVTADATATSFSSLFTVNSKTEPLPFQLIDADRFKKIWTADYNFQQAGVYQLKVILIDDNDFVAQDSLSWTVDLAGLAKGCFQSNDGKLSVEYPAAGAKSERVYILMQHDDKFQNNSLTLYSIISAKEPAGLLTVSYQQNFNPDPYYSFYKVENHKLRRVETWINKNGNFQAALNSKVPFLFTKSSVAAQRRLQPENELLCHPNPFNSGLKIIFPVETKSQAKLSIYNVRGQAVYSKYYSELEPGRHITNWNVTSENGAGLSSGIYFIQFKCGTADVLIKKVTLIK